MELGHGPKPGSRDNGLRAARYIALADLDPRVADALLDVLHANGIAAYAEPTPGARGGYLEVRLPHRLTDRLFVDVDERERADELVTRETAHHAEAAAATAARPAASELDGEDLDRAWRDVLTSLRAPSATASRDLAPWPASEDVRDSSRYAGPDPFPPAPPPSYDDAIEDPVEPEDHFVPPAPPPLPRPASSTVASVIAILVGLAIIVTGVDGGAFMWLGVVILAGGFASLVWHMRPGPPNDSGWDDGAVV